MGERASDPGAARWQGMRILLGFALVLLLALGSLYGAGKLMAFRRETEPCAVAPVGPGTRFVATRSGRVHVLDLGKGNAILLLHGSGRSVADWQEGFAERLAKSYRVVAFDNYGFGQSDRDHAFQYGNALWARQAIDVLDALGVERAVVMGHSAGGVVAASLAADHPERVRATVFVGHGLAMDPAQLIPFIPGVGEFMMGRAAVFGCTRSERHCAQLKAAYRIRGTREAFLTFVRRQYTIDGLRLLWGTYEEITVPVLQVHGSLDLSIPIAAAHRLTGRLRNARLVEVEGASHDVHLDAPDRLAEEIAIFAAGLESSAPGDLRE